MEAKAKRTDPKEALTAEAAEDTGGDVAEIVDESPPEAAVDETTTQPLVLDSEIFRDERSKTKPTGVKHANQHDVPATEVASLLLDEILSDVLTRMQERRLIITPEPAVQDQTEGNGTEVILTTFSGGESKYIGLLV